MKVYYETLIKLYTAVQFYRVHLYIDAYMGIRVFTTHSIQLLLMYNRSTILPVNVNGALAADVTVSG